MSRDRRQRGGAGGPRAGTRAWAGVEKHPKTPPIDRSQKARPLEVDSPESLEVETVLCIREMLELGRPWKKKLGPEKR